MTLNIPDLKHGLETENFLCTTYERIYDVLTDIYIDKLEDLETEAELAEHLATIVMELRTILDADLCMTRDRWSKLLKFKQSLSLVFTDCYKSDKPITGSTLFSVSCIWEQFKLILKESQDLIEIHENREFLESDHGLDC